VRILRAAAVLASGDFVFIDDFVFEIDGMHRPAQRAARTGLFVLPPSRR
jgi:hypothetical protein